MNNLPLSPPARRKPNRFISYKKLLKRRRVQKRIHRDLLRRNRAQMRLKLYGISAIVISLLFLLVFLSNIVSRGYSAFLQTQIRLDITLSPQESADGNYQKMIRDSLLTLFPDIVDASRQEKKQLYALLSQGAKYQLQDILTEKPDLLGKTSTIWLPASSEIDMFYKGNISLDAPEANRMLKDQQMLWFHSLQDRGRVKTVFNPFFFTEGDSRIPELAGILGSLVGSLWVVFSCMMIAFPLAVATAIYLEEFAAKNRFTTFIEININNLAAVPSIIFGLLGLTVYLQFFGLPRSSALVGGLTLALMALPVIVIATRAAIRAIPSSIREGAIALGASKLQVVMHHIVPLAMPGIMTGSILSIARIMGETAPLLMIGMVAFIVGVPDSLLAPSSALPVQIYLWADSPEMAYAEKTSAAILVLLLLLAIINAVAVVIRKKFETRW